MKKDLRGIAVVDVGYTNSKVLLFTPTLELVGERKMPSPHRKGTHYGEIDVDAMLVFFRASLAELDAILPIDRIVTSAHGACIVTMDDDGQPVVPIMDYMSEPPAEILADYLKVAPSFAETYSPQLPMALLHAVQLFWQSRVLPQDFARAKTILPLMQYVAHRLGGKPVTEISSMGCQTHLLNLNNFGPSSLAVVEGWAGKFAPLAKAWDVIGTYSGLRGRGEILAGVHDSNANFLRYLASGTQHFTLLSTGTWIIGFDSDADIKSLDPLRDTVANVSVLGKPVASCRFFGGKEFEVIAGEGNLAMAGLDDVTRLVAQGTFAFPSFTGSGGPLPETGGKGRLAGPAPKSPQERAALASVYCALMVSESLDAIGSRHAVIVDGPFSQNPAFLAVLASLRPTQKVLASDVKDGTAAGAACLALMESGVLPRIETALHVVVPLAVELDDYKQSWRASE